jgi:hypothetical protein
MSPRVWRLELTVVGNCTYDPFYTLGFDFQCKDMTNFLELGCFENTSAEWMIGVVDRGPRLNPNITSCGWHMNPGPDYQLQLMSGYELANGLAGQILATRVFPIQDLISNRIAMGGSPNFIDVQNPVTNFILVSTPGGFDGALKNTPPVLTECEIHWVVKQLNATVVSGKLIEEAIDTLQFTSNLTSPYAPWNGLNGSSYEATFSMTLPDSHSVTGISSTFGLTNTTAFKVWEAWSLFAPSALVSPVKGAGEPGIKFSWWHRNDDGSGGSLAAVMETLPPILPWDSPNNITQHMEEAVTVMNQILRRTVLSQSHTHNVAVGQAWRYVVLVKINWVCDLLLALECYTHLYSRSGSACPLFYWWVASRSCLLLLFAAHTMKII